tara:strand:- start:51 stop:197 length:147 start_codon:yes stop_codon:yes gene_type:complete
MSSNEFNLIRIEALEKRIQELETQLKLETIKPPTKFKKINKWKANQPQ